MVFIFFVDRLWSLCVTAGSFCRFQKGARRERAFAGIFPIYAEKLYCSDKESGAQNFSFSRPFQGNMLKIRLYPACFCPDGKTVRISAGRSGKAVLAA